MTGVPDTAGILAGLLRPRQETAVEAGGATAVLEAVAGGPLTAEVLTAAGHELTGGERELLRPGARDVACRRRGLLRTASGVPAAEVTAVLLPGRIPARALRALGITAEGAPLEGGRTVPLGRALRGLGVRRCQLDVAVTPGRADAAGECQVLYSAALLRLPSPIALVTERVYLAFVAAFPPPWPGLPACDGTAPGRHR